MNLINNSLAFLHLNNWIVQILIALILTLIANRAVLQVLTKLQKKFRKTSSVWDNTLIKSLKAPTSFILTAIGLSISAEILNDEYDLALLISVSTIRDLCIIASVAWFALIFIKEGQKAIILKKLSTHEKIDRATVDAISTIATILVVVVTILMTLQTLGFHIGGLLALGGVGGIAVGFAAKDLLSNFFGGLMIYFDRPFQIGDWIRSPDKDIEGTVAKIGWRQTKIMTFSHRPIYIPNSVFSTIIVENPSRMTNRQIHEFVGVRYDDVNKLEKIIDDVTNMLIHNDEIDNNKTMIVNVDTFGPSSINFFVYAATITTQWIHFHKVKQDVLLKIAAIIADNGAEIAFPTSTIHLASGVKNTPPFNHLGQ